MVKSFQEQLHWFLGLQVGKNYYYRLKSNGANADSDYSKLVVWSQQRLQRLQRIQAEPPILHLLANWNAVSGVSNYKLYVSENSSFSSHLSGYDGKIISGTTSLVSGLQPGKNYYYRLKSNGANADSDYSNKITANTSIDAPTAKEETGRTTTSFVANWSAVLGVSNYKLYVSENSSFSSHLSGYNGKIISGTTSLVSGLQAGKNYYYRLKSNGANADSDYSNKITANTSIDAPTAEEELAEPPLRLWPIGNSVSGTKHYKLDISTTSTLVLFSPDIII